MKTVIIMGAGVPRAASAGRKSKRNCPPLDADFFCIAKHINSDLTNIVIRSLEKSVGDYADTITKSLETATTYLYLKALDSATGSIYHDAFLNMLQLINETLAYTTNNIKVGPRSPIYRCILNELKKLNSSEGLSIITFNYDLLIESTLDNMVSNGHPNVFVFPGCYRLNNIAGTPGIKGSPQFSSKDTQHKGVKILKLHGSLNWQSRHTSFSPKAKALFNPRRELHIMDSPEIPRSLSWRRNQRRIYMKPIIVPPISGKRTLLHESMSSIWIEAAKTLQEADRILIIGYSCPPFDLEARMLLSENLRLNSNKRAYAIDPNAEVAARYVEVCGINHVTIYTSIQEWLNDAPNYN